MRPPLDGSVVLVTGASSGIGRELARQLAGRVRALVLVARRADRLAALSDELRAARADLVVRVEACDIQDRAAVDRMLDGVEREVGPIDVLVNNAGFGDLGMFDLASWSKLEQLLLTNVVALTYLTRRLVGPMVARRRGGILNVSSGFGLEFMPGFAVYVGSKHYVTGFTESLRIELRQFGVVVSQLCPGPVATEFDEVAGVPGGMLGPVQMDAARCARAAVRAFARGRALIVPGLLMKLVMGLGAITPRVVRRWVYPLLARRMRAIQERAAAREGARPALAGRDQPRA